MSKEINVYVDGVFDLFHEGHINFLRIASSYGPLIVGVHDDAFVMSYKRRPVVPESSRYAVVGACKYVTQMIEGVGNLTEAMIDQYNIGMVIHGSDFSEADINKHYKAAVNRGIYRSVPYTEGISSSLIIAHIRERISMKDPIF